MNKEAFFFSQILSAADLLLHLSDKQRNVWLDPVVFLPLTLAFIWIVLYLPAAAADDKKGQGALRPAPNDFLSPILILSSRHRQRRNEDFEERPQISSSLPI